MSYPEEIENSYESLRKWLLDDKIPTGEFVILAESFSGPLAIKLSGVENCKNLKAIILVNSFVSNPINSQLIRIFEPLFINTLSIWINRFLLRWFLLGNHRIKGLEKRVQAIILGVPPSLLAARIQALSKVDVSAEFQEIQFPICYLRGKSDRLVGKGVVQRMCKLNPKMVLVEIEGPHLLLQLNAEKSAQKIVEFLVNIGMQPARGAC